jgi:hypothetical protein
MKGKGKAATEIVASSTEKEKSGSVKSKDRTR